MPELRFPAFAISPVVKPKEIALLTSFVASFWHGTPPAYQWPEKRSAAAQTGKYFLLSLIMNSNC
jgi:hypothetical protein